MKLPINYSVKNPEKKSLKLETLAIKNAKDQYNKLHPVSAPIYLSSTYERSEDGSYAEGFVYGRHDNPNRRMLEKNIATLENGAVCHSFGSGMAAVSAVFQSLKMGDHVLLPDDVYFNIQTLIEGVFRRWGLEHTKVNMSDLQAVSSAIQSNTALIWIETPSNPQLKISDIRALSTLAKAKNILVAVDNTWPTPILQTPLNLGANIVVHSTPKYFGGHSDVLGGCVVFKEKDEHAERIKLIQTHGGGIPAPFDCWLIARGIQTLHLRVTKQTENAQKLADWLVEHPRIHRVLYPGLKYHPNHQIAAQQMHGGFGAMLSVLIDGDETQTVKVSTQLQLFTTATSLGGVESLIEHRKSVEGPSSQTPANLLRISIGIENIADLISDWEQALMVI